MIVCTASAGGLGAQTRPSNLRVLPPAISEDSLIGIMGGFTRALGVQCRYCHTEKQGSLDFASDDKITKRTARDMLRMVALLNDSLLSALPSRASSPSVVACGTCHRGLPVPRTLQDSLRIVYTAAGYESMIAEYRKLREETFGDGTFDFSEVPLADVGAYMEERGAAGDAERTHALNVEDNPRSTFAKRQHTGIALLNAFTLGVQAGSDKWDELELRYPSAVFRADILLGVAESLNRVNRERAAVAVLIRASSLHPRNAGIWEGLGDIYVKGTDRSLARDAYSRALAISPQSETLRAKLNAILR